MLDHHPGFPEGDFDHLDPGWHLRYWDPNEKYLAAHPCGLGQSATKKRRRGETRTIGAGPASACIRSAYAGILLKMHL